MTIGSKEYDEILEQFERLFSWCRLDRVCDENVLRKVHVYESEETNTLYRAFLHGYALGRVKYIH